MMTLHPTIAAVTDRIISRSATGRRAYLDLIAREGDSGIERPRLSCGNLAHGFAAAEVDKPAIRGGKAMNIGIVTSFNDMLSAHQPYGRYPEQMKLFAREVGATAQVAGGVPAMCDGVTQGQTGMELSLFSRDTIALSTAIALSHGMFEGLALLGICDKIVPGLIIGALRFGHLPTILIPAGPMPSGLPNAEKARVRQAHAEGKATREELLAAEAASYHSAGTCTFYGTANSNQMLLEMMGLQLPGTSFVNPNTPLRDALTVAAAERACAITGQGANYTPIGRTLDEKAIVNAMVGLAATGGSTNHAIHLVAVARVAGLHITWDDLDELSRATPLLARVYPNGQADVNHFAAAGGLPFVIRELIDGGLLHPDIACVGGGDLRAQAREPWLDDGVLQWRDPPAHSGDANVLRPLSDPFDAEGGLRCLSGNLGRAIVKVSAVKHEHRRIEAPVRIFISQDEMLGAFKAGQLTGDFIAVVRGQGPRANGMPELHKLTPALGVMQDRGQRVALLTDGRMSGASGKVLAAIHVVPEAACGGAIARLREGDVVRIDSDAGVFEAVVDAAEWAAREPTRPDTAGNRHGVGRELFGLMRAHANSAEQGGSALFAEG